MKRARKKGEIFCFLLNLRLYAGPDRQFGAQFGHLRSNLKKSPTRHGQDLTK